MKILPVETEPGEIPKIVHMFWVGGPPPKWVEAIWDIYRNALDYGDWKLWLWTDETIKGTPLESTYHWAKAKGMSERGNSDILRIEAISIYGGIYTDCDTLPLQKLDWLTGKRNGWIGNDPSHRNTNRLNNATFGFSAHHPFLAAVWERARNQIARNIRNDHFVAGPATFRAVHNKYIGPPIDIYWTFLMGQDADMKRKLREAEPFDLEEMSARLPETPICHITFAGASQNE